MTIDILLAVLGLICMVVGIIGCVLPALPGVTLSYVGILLLHFTSRAEFSTYFLIAWAVVVVVVQVIDYYVPIWGTKRFGGGSKGVWGSMAGVVVGMFVFPPWGIILFPFVGAVLGEMLDNKKFDAALKAGFGAFVGFVAGTLIKLVVSLILLFYFVREAYISFI